MADSPRRCHAGLHLQRRVDLVIARWSREPANRVLQRPGPGMDRYPGGRLHLSEHRPGAQLEQGAATAGPADGPAPGHSHPVRGAAGALGALYGRTERHEPQPVHRLRDPGRIDNAPETFAAAFVSVTAGWVLTRNAGGDYVIDATSDGGYHWSQQLAVPPTSAG